MIRNTYKIKLVKNIKKIVMQMKIPEFELFHQIPDQDSTLYR